jgi:ribonuclease Z
MSRKFVAAFFSMLSGVVGVSLAFAADNAEPGAVPRVESPAVKVLLLGTGAGPPVRLNRYQTTTLVEAGGERFLFDCGRGVTLRLLQAKVPIASVSKLFLTHLHSDHSVDIPDLYLTGWVQGRRVPFQVWGPTGTRNMMTYIQKAFAYDIHVRRDVDEKIPKEGIVVESFDIAQGVVYEKNGVKVTAFLVDHAPVTPAFGYRVDYAGHSVVLSGDTKFSENLIKYAEKTDVLIHEAVNPEARRAQLAPGASPQQLETILAHHTSAEQAGTVFARVQPRLAVFSHIGDEDMLTPARKNYSGPLVTGEDLMTIAIGEQVEVKRFAQ